MTGVQTCALPIWCVLHSRLFRNQIFPDNGDDHACRSNVLLYAAVDHAVLLYVDRLTQETGGYVSNQRLTLGVRQLFIFCTINGVVFADVNIVRIIINGQIGAVRDIGESLILRRGNLYSLAVLLCLLISLLCPLTSDNIVCQIGRASCRERV